MGNLFYEASETTPAVILDRDQGLLEVRGESYPENALAFFQPVVEGVGGYLAQGNPSLTIRIDLSYLNTSSVKALMDILDRAEEAHERGAAVEVEWVYDAENDRSLEMAEELREDMSLPFRVSPVSR
ncbi:SiaC family regulatory phosphoprotein [Thiohalorhabdus sp. Cl-TMA]|uniref:SiaC family regulatory phosphoprotein n=1 Tax=Thiohalorhabdus methylotrophus TaxID=3242694 RepID=A0ABV4TTS5_9GAMM